MNEYDNHTFHGTVQIPEVSKAITKLETDMRGWVAAMSKMEGDILALRAQLAEEMVVQQILRTYIEYLNPADGDRAADPMSYADWIKLQSVSDQIISARAAA